MAEGDIGAEIDRLEFEAGTATGSRLIHVTGDIFAIAYTGPDGDGWIQTVEIDSAGAIPAAAEGGLEFDASAANDIDFIKVASGVFAVVYRDSVNDGWIVTVNISDNGATLSLTGSSFEFETGECYEPSIVKVADNVFAIAYRNSSVHGKVITVSITDAGVIGDPILDSLDFEATRGIAPHIIHVTGDIFAIAYQGVDDDGWLVTVEIDSAGAIPATIEDSFEFDTADIAGARILQVDVDTYVIVYTNSLADGDMVTVSIDDTGNIGAAILDDQVFETGTGNMISIIAVSGDFFAIAYRGTSDDGWLKSWEISDAGVIAALKQDELEFDATHGAQPVILHISGSIYAIAYTSGAAGGAVISVDIETVVAAAAIQYLPLMGIG
jgi:hypothetical protein